jgi:hypothetical protein
MIDVSALTDPNWRGCELTTGDVETELRLSH